MLFLLLVILQFLFSHFISLWFILHTLHDLVLLFSLFSLHILTQWVYLEHFHYALQHYLRVIMPAFDSFSSPLSNLQLFLTFSMTVILIIRIILCVYSLNSNRPICLWCVVIICIQGKFLLVKNSLHDFRILTEILLTDAVSFHLTLWLVSQNSMRSQSLFVVVGGGWGLLLTN